MSLPFVHFLFDPFIYRNSLLHCCSCIFIYFIILRQLFLGLLLSFYYIYNYPVCLRCPIGSFASRFTCFTPMNLYLRELLFSQTLFNSFFGCLLHLFFLCLCFLSCFYICIKSIIRILHCLCPCLCSCRNLLSK